MKWNQDELARIFEYGLCIPPARTGLRLKSEPELARMLEINRMLIRSMLSDFVERDILLRRHGSGTYLRKLPGRSWQATEGVDMDWAVVVLKKGIFARPEAPLLRRRTAVINAASTLFSLPITTSKIKAPVELIGRCFWACSNGRSRRGSPCR